ncbi:MAG: PGPGW domain-containing protein [Aeromicrobium sp.]
MPRWLHRTAGEILGWALVVGGIALLVLPGPGLIVLVAGVAMLAPHYEWARRILDPLRKRAVKGAKQGVSTIPRILATAAGSLWLVGLGVVWLISPDIPEFSVLGWHVGPKLPGGLAAAIGLLTSGVIAGAVLAYSVGRWYPGKGKRHVASRE